MSDVVTIKSNAFISTFTVDPKKREEFVRLFDALWRGSLEIMAKETHFVFYGWARNPNEFVAIESWKSEEVTNALRATDGFKQAVSALLACCSAPMTMQVFNGIEMPRTVFDTYPKGVSKVHPSVGKITTVFL
jgi:quinol monooxygenase YgiN